jgi:hypothetical protein
MIGKYLAGPDVSRFLAVDYESASANVLDKRTIAEAIEFTRKIKKEVAAKVGSIQNNTNVVLYSLWVGNGAWGRISQDGEIEKLICLRDKRTLFTDWIV